MSNNVVKNFPMETVVLGFTGPLGSGCTYVAKEIAEREGYLYYQLSKPIHDKTGKDAGYKELQDLGNEMRDSEGADILASKATDYAEEMWSKASTTYKGLILDGIRNAAEVEYLRQLPNFFLIAVHAEFDVRLKRLLRNRKVSSREEFEDVDRRDSEEHRSCGQQVKKCTYLSDVIFNNDTDIAQKEPGGRERYIRDSVVGKVVRLIKSQETSTPEHAPSRDETLMTMAYCASKRSQCAKRKVGAVIATAGGVVVSSGYNDVPTGQRACILKPDLQQCARDELQERFAQDMAFCPKCGTKIDADFVCRCCGEKLDSYRKRCPKCGKDPDVSFKCRKCRADVFTQFVLGAGQTQGKLLGMCRSLHAEEIAIVAMARHGGGVPEGTVLYTTTFPCNLCANKIVVAGIREIVYAEPYSMPEAMKILKSGSEDTKEITVRKFEGVKSTAFFRLYQ